MNECVMSWEVFCTVIFDSAIRDARACAPQKVIQYYLVNTVGDPNVGHAPFKVRHEIQP